MNKNFKDYFWKEGIPYGIEVADSVSATQGLTYKIIMDPYRKRISIESYRQGQFSAVVYDSALLDFRHLKAAEQTAWQKIIIYEGDDGMRCLIRNQEDRLLFVETYLFQEGLCRECRVVSAHGVPLSLHRMFYTALHDAFNGVILYDQNSHPVMSKRYEVDKDTSEFTTLLLEDWNLKK